MLNKFYKNYRLLVDTAIIVVGILLLKILVVESLSLEFFSLSSLFTSIIAGGIFIASILLGGVIADFKEGDKLPAEIIAAIESIYEDGLYVKKLRESFNVALLCQRLNAVIQSLREDLNMNASGRKAIAALSQLSESLLEMERLGVPANYIVRLKQEQSAIRKAVFRIYHIQRIRFIPSAYILLQTFVGLIIGLLIFTKIEPPLDGSILVAVVSYLFVYILKLIRKIDDPFSVGEKTTMDEVSLFLLREHHGRAEKTEDDSPPVQARARKNARKIR